MISGEHGIGITKLEFLTDAETAEFRDYKERVDPQGRFNRGKLLPGGDLRNAYTPSFNLLGHESLIMQQSDINSISDAIKDCLRCGKCKPVCATHVPRANLLYSPRNKILATSLLIEAFLYEEQTRRGVSIRHFDEFSDVADHCTVCHKCEKPCPVDIDFGDVSMAMRDLLRRMGKKRFNAGTAAAMVFLNATNPETIKLARKAMLEWGFKAQRLGNRVLRRVRERADGAAAGDDRQAAAERAGRAFREQEDAGRPAEEDGARAARHRGSSLRADHSRSGAHQQRVGSGVLFSGLRLGAPVLAGRPRHAGHAVARRRADGAAAGLPVLRLSAARRRPVRQGREDHHRQPRAVPSRREHAQLSRHQAPWSSAAARAYDQLQGYKFDEIFPGCRIIDIHEYLMERGVQLAGVTGVRYMYHDPCHSPIKSHDPLKVVNTLLNDKLNGRIEKNDRCCGESGTFAMTRPDVATQVRFRKEQEMRAGAARLRADGFKGEVKVLTSCPSCMQGLKRYNDDADLDADYIVVEIARHVLGPQWLPEYVRAANNGGIERVLV